MRRISMISVLAFLAVSLVSMSARGESMRVVEQEAVAAFLNTLEPSNSQPKLLILASTTATTDEAFVGTKKYAGTLAADFPKATKAVIRDFLRVASVRTNLEISNDLVSKTLRFQIADQNSLDKIFDLQELSKGWERFYKDYPDAAGLTRISRVGVDTNAGQALFYISFTPASLGGVGFFVLLNKHLNVWHVLSTKQAWIS